MSFTARYLTKTCRTGFYALLLALVGLSPLAGSLRAQSATTGAIGGSVTDASGALLPGTAVTVTSVATGAMRMAKTNAQGEYRISDLQPDVYKVTFAADGFKTREETAVTVTVGGLVDLSPKLSAGATGDKVEVSDEATLLNTENNAITSTIDQNAIDNLPINGRRWSNFALLTPGVVSNSDGFGLLSFRGISVLLNNSTVDGADNNQAYFSEERGRTRASYSISQSAVQEFQVNLSNYSAEYGRAAGGVINTVTKSGGNAYHGELFFYDRDNDFGADQPLHHADHAGRQLQQLHHLPLQAQGLAQAVGLRSRRSAHPRQALLVLLLRPEPAELPRHRPRLRPHRLTFAPADTTLPSGYHLHLRHVDR